MSEYDGDSGDMSVEMSVGMKTEWYIGLVVGADAKLDCCTGSGGRCWANVSSS